MNSKNSKISYEHIILLNLTDKIDLQRGEKGITLLNRSISYTCKNIMIH